MPRESSWLPSLLSEWIDELIVEFNVVLEKGKIDNKQGGQIKLKPSINWQQLKPCLTASYTALSLL